MPSCLRAASYPRSRVGRYPYLNYSPTGNQVDPGLRFRFVARLDWGRALTWVRRRWFPLTSGLLCFAWAFLGWLTVIPNQDILADGIQAQSIITDPRIVLAFPGQKHGGPLEYPFTTLAEAIAPGNWYANAAIRPLLAFATGFVLARLFLQLFPSAPRWAFITAIAVGPTILHGLLGPEGNPVGVWWLQPNWDMAWLLVASGSLILASVLGRLDGSSSTVAGSSRVLWLLAGGLLVGLGFYAHPAIFLLIVPLAALVLLRSQWSWSALPLATAGAVLGIIPAAISYFVNDRVNTWDPSHGAFIALDYYRSMGASVLGLDGIPDYMKALLPYAFGLAPSTDPSTGRLQSILMWAVVAVVVVGSIVAITTSIRRRRRVGPGGALALSWLVGIATIFAFITFVDPVWIYSSGLAVLGLITIGALPIAFTIHWIGNVLAGGAVATMAVSTVAHNAYFYADIPARLEAKAAAMEADRDLADRLLAAGARYVYGSYYDVIPVGYASGMELRTLTNRYNRFPLTEQERSFRSITVAVNLRATDVWGHEALTRVTESCSGPLSVIGNWAAYDCAPLLLDSTEAEPPSN